VIIRTPFQAGAANCRNQITYPLTTTMLSVPGRRRARLLDVRRFVVYILFDDGTDPYWARSRVLDISTR